MPLPVGEHSELIARPCERNFAAGDVIAAIESRPLGRWILDSHFLRSPNPHVYFLTVHKAASTFVKHVLFHEKFGDLDALEPGYFWSNMDHHGILHATIETTLRIDGRAVLSDWDATIISFCRNPYDRFVSAYLNKIVHPRSMEVTHHEWVRREILFRALRSGRYDHNVASFSGGILPIHFAEFIRDSNPAEIDTHWASQADIILPDLIASLIIPFESFEPTFRRLWSDRIGVFPLLPAELQTNRTDRGRRVLDVETADIIYGMFRRDFDLFGYDRDSWIDY